MTSCPPEGGEIPVGATGSRYRPQDLHRVPVGYTHGRGHSDQPLQAAEGARYARGALPSGGTAAVRSCSRRGGRAWFNAPVLKTGRASQPSRVRIPPPPPYLQVFLERHRSSQWRHRPPDRLFGTILAPYLARTIAGTIAGTSSASRDTGPLETPVDAVCSILVHPLRLRGFVHGKARRGRVRAAKATTPSIFSISIW